MARTIAWLMLIVMATALYAPGRNGALYFDDHPNLGALSTADSLLKRIDFIFSGEAGPTGRPLSLATFALQQAHYAHDLPILFSTNIALHILNGCLVGLLAWMLAGVNTRLRMVRHQVTFFAAACWLLSPFLASAPLILVQRMTLLSGLFVFAGLALYVYGRTIIDKRPLVGKACLFVALVPFTALAMLAKENGVLLPVLALVVEVFILSARPGATLPPLRQSWIKILLWLPFIAIGAYLGTHIPHLFEPSSRPFTLMDRVLTQPVILWDYIFNLLIPRPRNISPFSDDWTAVRSTLDWRFLLAMGAWVIAIATAALARKKHPWVFFGLAFFLAGHLLESSIVNLELYFPHRNYVPAFGLYFALACLLASFPKRAKILFAGGLAYISVIAVTLWSTTALWGNPPLAAEMWAIYKKESPRAQHHLAARMLEEGDHRTAHRLLSEIAATTDRSAIYRIQALMLCRFQPADKNAQLDQVIDTIKHARLENGMGLTLELLAATLVAGGCPSLDETDMEKLFAVVLSNPEMATDKHTLASIYKIRAQFANEQAEHEKAMSYRQKAYELTKKLDSGLEIVTQLTAMYKFDSALSYLAKLRADSPTHWVRGYVWRKRVDGWITTIKDERERFSQTLSTGETLEEFRRRSIESPP